MRLTKALTLALSSLVLIAQPGNAFVLENEIDDFSLIVDVDPFGSITDATVFTIDNAFETIFESNLYLGFQESNLEPNLNFVNSVIGDGATIIDEFFEDGQYITIFENPLLGDRATVTLTQNLLTELTNSGDEAIVLEQNYEFSNITNTGIDLIRYLDADLLADGTLQDLGGIFDTNDSSFVSPILYTSEASTLPFYVGITADVTTPGIIDNSSYTANPYPQLQVAIEDNQTFIFNNFLDGDLNGDGSIDVPNDVTVAYNNSLGLGSFASFNYTTQTIWGLGGNFIPLEDFTGTSQFNPLLPATFDEVLGFTFNDVPSGLWYDPPVVDTFEISVEGTTITDILAFPVGFDSPFTLSVDGNVLATNLVGGDSYTFANPVTSFSVSGISPVVDAEDPTAFPLQLAFSDRIAPVLNFLPVVSDEPTEPVSTPEPASLLAFLAVGAFGANSALKRKKAVS